jgi:hypothetical protein
MLFFNIINEDEKIALINLIIIKLIRDDVLQSLLQLV